MRRITTTAASAALALLAGLAPAPAAGPPAKPAPAPPKTPAEPSLPPINAKVLAFARGKVGEKVGDGQCTSLAIAAVREAGARRYPFEGGGDFVWGEPVDSFREALPGDILQFRDAVFKGRRNVSSRRVVTWHHEYPHHTAIVAGVKDNGKLVTLLHQNVGPRGSTPEDRQKVREETLRADSLQDGGHVWIYRPSPRRAGRPSFEDGFEPGN